jgi:glycosyltransferase involved in cell wall biosynthesis
VQEAIITPLESLEPASIDNRLQVVWIGAGEDELDAVSDLADADVIALERGLGTDGILRRLSDPPAVLQLGPGEARLARLRRELPRTRLVLDLRDGVPARGRGILRDAEAADTILLASLDDIHAFRAREPRLADRTALVRRPLDLDFHAPLEGVVSSRDRELKRFRRLYRLVGPAVLFAGPYTEAGGLDVALEAVYALRERTPELRLAAIPHGPIDSKYLDRCEGRALGLGHHGLVQWQVAPEDVPLWYATATVVCLPCRDRVPSPAATLAGAAGRPFVGSRVDSLASEVEDGETGFLVTPGDVSTLTAAIELLLTDEEEAARLGRSARLRVQAERSAAAVARRLHPIWLHDVRARVVLAKSERSG